MIPSPLNTNDGKTMTEYVIPPAPQAAVKVAAAGVKINFSVPPKSFDLNSGG